MFTSNKKCLEQVTLEIPNFMQDLSNLLRTTKNSLVDSMCKDIIINFIRNGKMVPRELYQLVESDEDALRD